MPNLAGDLIEKPDRVKIDGVGCLLFFQWSSGKGEIRRHWKHFIGV
jgi:hypothetical protein